MDRFQLALRFEPERLQQDLARAENMGWTDHFVTQNYTGSWSIIPLRAPAGETHPVRMIYPDPSCREFVDTPVLQECAYFREVLGAFQCPLDAVRLMKLDAGSAIKEHRDHELGLESGTVRLHIPVRTNPDVEFYLNAVRVRMEEGECWYLRLSDPHRVANNGTTDRVHLVVDAQANDWLREVLGYE